MLGCWHSDSLSEDCYTKCNSSSINIIGMKSRLYGPCSLLDRGWGLGTRSRRGHSCLAAHARANPPPDGCTWPFTTVLVQVQV